jgi:hypothetical protein
LRAVGAIIARQVANPSRNMRAINNRPYCVVCLLASLAKVAITWLAQTVWHFFNDNPNHNDSLNFVTSLVTEVMLLFV